MYLANYRFGDMEQTGETEQEVIDGYEQIESIGLRTIKNGAREVVAVCAFSRDGEIGLHVNHERITNIRKFCTLIDICMYQAFLYCGRDRLYTGIVPNSRDTRWAKFLHLKPATKTIPEHAERGAVTHEFLLTNWVRHYE